MLVALLARSLTSVPQLSSRQRAQRLRHAQCIYPAVNITIRSPSRTGAFSRHSTPPSTLSRPPNKHHPSPTGLTRSRRGNTGCRQRLAARIVLSPPLLSRPLIGATTGAGASSHTSLRRALRDVYGVTRQATYRSSYSLTLAYLRNIAAAVAAEAKRSVAPGHRDPIRVGTCLRVIRVDTRSYTVTCDCGRRGGLKWEDSA